MAIHTVSMTFLKSKWQQAVSRGQRELKNQHMGVWNPKHHLWEWCGLISCGSGKRDENILGGKITIKMETEEENAVQRDSYLLTESLYISNSIGLWQRLFDDALLRDGQEQLPYSFTNWRVTGRCARSARGMHFGGFAEVGVRSSQPGLRKPNAHTSVTHPSYTLYRPTAVSSSISYVLLGSSWIDAPYCTPHVSFFVFV